MSEDPLAALAQLGEDLTVFSTQNRSWISCRSIELDRVAQWATIIQQAVQAMQAQQQQEHPICRLQLPDGSVPVDNVSALVGWKAAYDALLTSWAEMRADRDQLREALKTALQTCAGGHEAWSEPADSHSIQADEYMAMAEALAESRADRDRLREALKVLVTDWNRIADNFDSVAGMSFTARQCANDLVMVLGCAALPPEAEPT